MEKKIIWITAMISVLGICLYIKSYQLIGILIFSIGGLLLLVLGIHENLINRGTA